MEKEIKLSLKLIRREIEKGMDSKSSKGDRFFRLENIETQINVIEKYFNRIEDLNVLQEADRLTSGDRKKAYGDAKTNFKEIANIFNAMTGLNLTPEEIIKVQIATKLAREKHSHKRDNLVDLAGYTKLLDEVINKC